MSDKAKRAPRLSEPTYMFICTDGPKTKPLREEHLFGHLDHIEANNDAYRIAGPFRDDASGEILGSFFLVKADSKDAAWEIMRGDPYISSDMYASITCQHFMPACGEWMGGVIWDQDEIRANMPKYT
ncbi:YciI family protein [Fretibacter rubidus]|uniref:YciI family protein n=1 Tax=Fretibacter rubidus TaxID=570162 RepID=UPI00352B70DB